MAAVSAIWSRKFMNFGILNMAHSPPQKESYWWTQGLTDNKFSPQFCEGITKLLANRLAGYLHQMVSANQSVFVKGRFIQDNFMMVQQATRFLHQQKQPRVLLKLDISKAFDLIS